MTAFSACLSALEVVRTLNDLGIKTKHPIVVTNWTNEEGARFAPAMLASGVFAGVHTLDYAYSRKDPDGKTVRRRTRSASAGSATKTVGARKMHAYFEYHIEQGPILEAEDKQIGVVTARPGSLVAGIHADRQGSPYRLDADEPCASTPGSPWRASSRWSRTVAMGEQPGAVGGVGQVQFSPNSRNVLPGTVVFTVDIRSPEQGEARLGCAAEDRSRGAEASAKALGVRAARVEACGATSIR